MQIAICDDEKIFRTELREYITSYKSERRIQLDIYEFENGKSFLDSKLNFDIVFLDFQMPDINGLETAKQLRLKNSLCSIVFITSYPDAFIKNAFEVNAYRFFDKPICADAIYAMLDSYIQQQKRLHPIIINDFDGQVSIPANDIVMIAGDGKYCKIHTCTKAMFCSKTMGGALRLLPQFCFYRTHKSYVINMYFVFKIENDCVIMSNGDKALLSRRYSTGFKKAYREFVKNYYVKL